MEERKLFLARKGMNFYFATEDKTPISDQFSEKIDGIGVIMNLFKEEKITFANLKSMFTMIISGDVPVVTIMEFEDTSTVARELTRATFKIPETRSLVENVKEVIKTIEDVSTGTFPRIYPCSVCGQHAAVLTGPAIMKGLEIGISLELPKVGDFYSKNDGISLVHAVAKEHSWDETIVNRLIQEIQETALPVNTSGKSAVHH